LKAGTGRPGGGREWNSKGAQPRNRRRRDGEKECIARRKMTGAWMCGEAELSGRANCGKPPGRVDESPWEEPEEWRSTP